jgi:hypothetical protein
MDFFLYCISCKENKCWKNFKIMRNLLFNYFIYSHLKSEISGCDSKQPLEEVLSLTILVLIVLAIPIAPLYMLYERLMGGESFIKLV